MTDSTTPVVGIPSGRIVYDRTTAMMVDLYDAYEKLSAVNNLIGDTPIDLIPQEDVERLNEIRIEIYLIYNKARRKME